MFSGRKPPPKPEESAKAMRELLNRFRERERSLNASIESETEQARELVSRGRTTAAAGHLHRRKHHELQLKVEQDKIAGFEARLATLEDAGLTVDAVVAVQSANASLRGIHQRVGVERVESVMDDMQDLMEQQDEINGAFARTGGQEVDEEDIQAELEHFIASRSPAEAPVPPRAVSSDPPPPPRDDALQELCQSMGL